MLQEIFLHENMPELSQLVRDESLNWDFIEQLQDEQDAYKAALQQQENDRQEVLENQPSDTFESNVSIIGLTAHCHQCGHVGMPDDECTLCKTGHYQTLLMSQEQILRHQQQWQRTHGFCAGHPPDEESKNADGLSSKEDVSTQASPVETRNKESKKETHMAVSGENVSADEDDIRLKADDNSVSSETENLRSMDTQNEIDPSTKLNFGIPLIDYFKPIAFYDPLLLRFVIDAKKYAMPKEYMTPIVQAHLEQSWCWRFEQAIEKDAVDGWIAQWEFTR